MDGTYIYRYFPVVTVCPSRLLLTSKEDHNENLEHIHNNTSFYLLQAFVQDVVKGKIKSRRLDYFKSRSRTSLRRACGLVMDNDATVSCQTLI